MCSDFLETKCRGKKNLQLRPRTFIIPSAGRHAGTPVESKQPNIQVNNVQFQSNLSSNTLLKCLMIIRSVLYAVAYLFDTGL